jgi:uncharacterized protein (TIGR02588 family)
MAQSKSPAKPPAKRPASRNRRGSGAPKPQPTTAGTPALEWIAAAVGAALALFVIGVIGWEALHAREARPPSILAERLGVSPIAGGYLVEIRVSNRGGRPAAQVLVEGELASPGVEPELSEATFDYIPDSSARTGGLFFKSDPALGTLTLRAKGFVEP